MAMASSTFKTCSICAEENHLKPKLGIHPCHGCQLAFCLTHLTKHRQDLLQKLDAVIMQRDELFENIFDNATVSTETMEISLEEINTWEAQMNNVVHETAEQTRDHLRLAYLTQLNEIKQRYDQFTRQLTEKRENDDFFEQDVERLAAELEHFKQEIHQIRVEPRVNPAESIDFSRLLRANEQHKPLISYLNSSTLLLERQMISLHNRNCFFLAASDTHILAYILSINRNENRLVLYSTSDGSELRSTELEVRLGNVCDMIYAPTLDRCFLVVCRHVILLYDPQQQAVTHMDEIKPIDEHPFWSIAVGSTTSDAFISLDSDGYIERWSTATHPKWKLIKRWNIKGILEDADQGIRMVRVCETRNQLAMVILQQDRYWRIDFFDFDLRLLQHGRPLMISNEIDKFSFGCRLLLLSHEGRETWLVNERSTRSLWLVNDSICKQVDKDVHSVCMISNSQRRRIVVSYSNDPKRIEIFNL